MLEKPCFFHFHFKTFHSIPYYFIFELEIPCFIMRLLLQDFELSYVIINEGLV